MTKTLGVTMVLLAAVSVASADWRYLRDLDRGETPNEYHKNIKDVHLTTEHARPGHVALAFRPDGKGWVTRYALWHNWTWYDRVAFRMHNANDKPVTFTFEVRTRHKRRANIRVTVKPGVNDVVLRFADFKNIAEKPFSLYDVGQWAMFFDGALAKPLYLSEIRLIRENIQLPRPTAGSMGKQWAAEHAELDAETEKTDTVPRHWVKMTFAPGTLGKVWLDLRHGERRYNTFALNGNWLGYERLTFLSDNPGPATEVELLLEDFTTFACRDTEYREGQAVVIPVAVPKGKQVLSVLLKDLKTADGKRWLDLSQMQRVGFRMKPVGKTVLRLADLRVRTTDENAGILVPSDGARKCVRCERRLDDVNCNVCPFCGKFYNARAVVTKPTPKSMKLFPVKDGCVMASHGGGGPTVDKTYGGLSVCHYDVSFWEGRAFLRFDPSTIPAGKRIRKAELRLKRRRPSQGKSWLCPMRIFVAPQGKGDFDEAALSWVTQPPIGSFAAQGGLYYYWTDAMAMDVTKFLKERLPGNRKPFTLILRAFEAEPCKENAHLFGHHFPFDAREARDETRRPHLYVEFE